MAETPSKGSLFLIIAFSCVAIAVIVWLVARTPQQNESERGPRIVEETPSQVADRQSREYQTPAFLGFIPPLNEAMGDHSTIPHGHGDELGYSNIIDPKLLSGEGCNLFGLDIYDADCDGIPNWLEDFHGTDINDPELPYHQGAWNYDGDGILHGMDGHYSCDMYPDILNCNARGTSNDETTTTTQDTDGSCVPDVIEIVRGTNPLDPTDDHAADVFGRTISSTRCGFGETTIRDTELSNLDELEPIDPLDTFDPVDGLDPIENLAQINPFSSDLSDDFDDLLDDIASSLELLQDYQEIDLDDSFLNVSSIPGAIDDIVDLTGQTDAYGTFLEAADGYADQGLDRYAVSDEIFTIDGSAGQVTLTCEEPGNLYVPYFWSPEPTTPQDISVTMSDEAGNVSDVTTIQEVEVNPDRWVLAIDRESPASRITDDDTVRFRVFINYEVTDLDVEDFIIRTTGTLEGEVASVASAGQFEYIVTVNNLTGEGILQLDFDLTLTVTGPDNRRLINPENFLISRQTYIVDRVLPEAPDVVTPADGGVVGNPGRAIVNCPGVDHTVDVSIAGFGSSVAECDARGPILVPLPAAPSPGPYDIDITIEDPLGRVSPTTTIADVSLNPNPVTASITRQSPASRITNSDTLTFRVEFSDPVDPVDLDDFMLIRTGNIQATLQSINAVSGLTTYDVEVSIDNESSGLVSIFLNEEHDIIEFTTDEPVSRNFIHTRELYRVDREIPERPAVVRPVTRGDASSPTGVVVQCMSGASSILFDPFDLVFDEYATFSENIFAIVQLYQFYVPLNEWRTRHDVRFDFDLEISTWDRGQALIRGWVDTQGLRIRPELRYAQVQGVPYVDQFRRYCVEGGRLGFQQANFEDGGWVWDILTMLLNAGQYKRVPVFAYVVDPATGNLELSDVIQTEPGQRVPFVVSVPRVNPDGTVMDPNDLLQTDGLYAFAIVDPQFVIPFSFDFFGIPIDIGIPVPVTLPSAASFIFTGPGCFDIFNKQVPVLTLDLANSEINDGFTRP